ncbi:MAG: hypothetical protein JST12_03295 [Armatimonadetes bacterium]|nr:hypothetical protein [Armatimonadota bacterium]
MGILLASLALAHTRSTALDYDFSSTCDAPTYMMLLSSLADDPDRVEYAGKSGPTASGNPGSFWTMKGVWTKSKVNLLGGMGDPWGFTLPSDAHIDSIDFTTDIRVENSHRPAIILILQNGKTYYGEVKAAQHHENAWQTVTRTFRDKDFTQLPNYGEKPPLHLGHPDFGHGSSMQFLVGFRQDGMQSSAGNEKIDYDNIHIHVAVNSEQAH